MGKARGHSPSSFMARRYSSSKDSFITAQVAWQICGSMGTGPGGPGDQVRARPVQDLAPGGSRPSLPSPPQRPVKTRHMQIAACLAPKEVPPSPRAGMGDEAMLGAQDLLLVLLS